jgi:lysophospholipase
VSDAYETGRALLDRGVVAGGDMTPECALAKLRYLLAKPGLSRERVRELVSAPIRGELTRRDAALAAGPATLEQSVGAIQSLLGQLVRLASGGTAAPTSTSTDGGDDVASEYSRDEGAPWTHTAAEAAAAEAALYPFLVHAAAARDDVAGVTLCVQAAAVSAPGGRAVPGGIVNCVDAASGRSPLHTAALNGSVRCTEMLLQAGALVHVRDLMGHTALYYVCQVSLLTELLADLACF